MEGINRQRARNGRRVRKEEINQRKERKKYWTESKNVRKKEVDKQREQMK